MSMRSSSEPAAVDASRGASLAAAAAASRPSSSARARLTRRAPLLRLRSPDVRGGPAGRGARRGRPVESPRSAPRAFTGPRHAARPGSRRVAIVVSAARVPRVCALTHATSPFFLEETTPAKINDRGGRRSDGTVNPRDERGARGANFSRKKRRAARRDPGSRIARAFAASNRARLARRRLQAASTTRTADDISRRTKLAATGAKSHSRFHRRSPHDNSAPRNCVSEYLFTGPD